LPENLSELNKKILDIEKRVIALEKATKDQQLAITEKKASNQTNLSGLQGGIRFLISKNFLSTPKTVNEILDELKREGYHYPRNSVNKIVSINLMQKQKILTRVKEDNVWKYALRK
jgi:predicted nucleic acid-binding protein